MCRATWNGAALAESDDIVVAFWKGVKVQAIEAI